MGAGKILSGGEKIQAKKSQEGDKELQLPLGLRECPLLRLWIKKHFVLLSEIQDCSLPPFSLICDFRKQNTWGNVSKISINHKQLLDEVFVISRIIKVEVRVISRSRRLRVVTLTKSDVIYYVLPFGPVPWICKRLWILPSHSHSDSVFGNVWNECSWRVVRGVWDDGVVFGVAGGHCSISENSIKRLKK